MIAARYECGSDDERADDGEEVAHADSPLVTPSVSKKGATPELHVSSGGASGIDTRELLRSCQDTRVARGSLDATIKLPPSVGSW